MSAGGAWLAALAAELDAAGARHDLLIEVLATLELEANQSRIDPALRAFAVSWKERLHRINARCDLGLEAAVALVDHHRTAGGAPLQLPVLSEARAGWTAEPTPYLTKIYDDVASAAPPDAADPRGDRVEGGES